MAEYICEINYEKDPCVEYKEPLVRCKDCKYWVKMMPEDTDRICDLQEVPPYTDPDDFCSRGERKESEE